MYVYIGDDKIDDNILLASQNSWEIDCSSDSETYEVAHVYYEDDEVDAIFFYWHCNSLKKNKRAVVLKRKEDFCQDPAE